jgi:acyl carrier protein
MVNFIEEKIDVTFPDEELARVQKIGDLVGLVRGGRTSG